MFANAYYVMTDEVRQHPSPVGLCPVVPFFPGSFPIAPPLACCFRRTKCCVETAWHRPALAVSGWGCHGSTLVTLKGRKKHWGAHFKASRAAWTPRSQNHEVIDQLQRLGNFPKLLSRKQQRASNGKMIPFVGQRGDVRCKIRRELKERDSEPKAHATRWEGLLLLWIFWTGQRFLLVEIWDPFFCRLNSNFGWVHTLNPAFVAWFCTKPPNFDFWHDFLWLPSPQSSAIGRFGCFEPLLEWPLQHEVPGNGDTDYGPIWCWSPSQKKWLKPLILGYPILTQYFLYGCRHHKIVSYSNANISCAPLNERIPIVLRAMYLYKHERIPVISVLVNDQNIPRYSK